MREAHSSYTHKFKHVELLLGILLLVAFGLIVNAIFAFQAARIANNSNQPASQASAPVATGLNDPTAGWKTYSSISKEYSIKFPPDWNVRGVPNVTFSSPDIQVTPGGTVVAGGEIAIFESDYSSTKPLSEVFGSRLAMGSGTSERKATTIGNLPALRYVTSGEGIEGTLTGAMVRSANKLYRIEAYYGAKDTDRIVAILDLLLKTIVFPAQ